MTEVTDFENTQLETTQPKRQTYIPADASLETFREYFMNPIYVQTEAVKNAFLPEFMASEASMGRKAEYRWIRRNARGESAVNHFRLYEAFFATDYENNTVRYMQPIRKARATALISAPIEAWHDAYLHAPDNVFFARVDTHAAFYGAAVISSYGAGTKTKHPSLNNLRGDIAQTMQEELTRIHREDAEFVEALCGSRAEKLYKKRKTLTLRQMSDTFPELAMFPSQFERL